MNRKQWLISTMGMTLWLAAPLGAVAGTFDQISSAIQSHYSAGAISDAEVKGILNELVSKAKATTGAQAQNTYRGAIIDVVEAYEGSGINSTAAANLRTLAQP